MTEKENLAKLEQQMNEKSLDLSNITPIIPATILENETSSNQTVDILQELLNTIKQNNQLEVFMTIKNKIFVFIFPFLFRQKSKQLNVILIMKMNVLKNYV